MESTPRFFTPAQDDFFLLGPWGTGKTWWTRRQFPDALRVDLLDPETLRSMAARPERLRERVAGEPGVKQVVIDEVWCSRVIGRMVPVSHSKQGMDCVVLAAWVFMILAVSFRSFWWVPL